MKHLESLWDKYSKTIPVTVAKDAIIEAKIAFFSGCASLFTIMMGRAKDITVTEDEGAMFLGEIEEDVEEFFTMIISAKPD